MPSKDTLNRSLADARLNKADEFYTQLSDIERELKNYKKHFNGKVVYCNCDDPRVSNFFHYLSYNFEKLGLKRLIATCYKSQDMDLFSQNDAEEAIWLEYHGDTNDNKVPDPAEIGIKPLKGDGDFRSPESIELLKQADIVVTNPRLCPTGRCAAAHDRGFCRRPVESCATGRCLCVEGLTGRAAHLPPLPVITGYFCGSGCAGSCRYLGLSCRRPSAGDEKHHFSADSRQDDLRERLTRF